MEVPTAVTDLEVTEVVEEERKTTTDQEATRTTYQTPKSRRSSRTSSLERESSKLLFKLLVRMDKSAILCCRKELTQFCLGELLLTSERSARKS